MRAGLRLWKLIARHWRVALLCVLWWGAASPAHAHKFGGPNDPCERKLGAALIHITLYQPQFDPDAENCDECPSGFGSLRSAGTARSTWRSRWRPPSIRAGWWIPRSIWPRVLATWR